MSKKHLKVLRRYAHSVHQGDLKQGRSLYRRMKKDWYTIPHNKRRGYAQHLEDQL